MGDFYTEQLVKRQKASSTTLIKAILIILTVLSVVLIFMIPFGIIGPVIMIALIAKKFQTFFSDRIQAMILEHYAFSSSNFFMNATSASTPAFGMAL